MRRRRGAVGRGLRMGAVVLLPEVAHDENIEDEDADFHRRQAMKQLINFQRDEGAESIDRHRDGPWCGHPEADALCADNEAIDQASDASESDLVWVDLAQGGEEPLHNGGVLPNVPGLQPSADELGKVGSDQGQESDPCRGKKETFRDLESGDQSNGYRWIARSSRKTVGRCLSIR